MPPPHAPPPSAPEPQLIEVHAQRLSPLLLSDNGRCNTFPLSHVAAINATSTARGAVARLYVRASDQATVSWAAMPSGVQLYDLGDLGAYVEATVGRIVAVLNSGQLQAELCPYSPPRSPHLSSLAHTPHLGSLTSHLSPSPHPSPFAPRPFTAFPTRTMQVEFCPPCSESDYTLTTVFRDVAWPLAARAAPPHMRTYNAAGALLGQNDSTSGVATLTLRQRSTRRLMLRGALRHAEADAPTNSSSCGRPDAPSSHNVRVRMIVSHAPNVRAAGGAQRCVHEYQTVAVSGASYALHVALPACNSEMAMVYEAAVPLSPGSDGCLDVVQPEKRTLAWTELIVPRATALGDAPPELWLSAVTLLPPCLQPSAGLGGVAYSLLPRRQPEVGAEGALHLTLRRGLGAAGGVVATTVTREGGRFAFEATLWPGMYTVQVVSADERALRVAAHDFSLMYNEADVRLGVLALSQADEVYSWRLQPKHLAAPLPCPCPCPCPCLFATPCPSPLPVCFCLSIPPPSLAYRRRARPSSR